MTLTVVWYAFCIFILNPNKGMIGLNSIGELTVYIREMNVDTAEDVRDFLDESKATEGLETEYQASRWKLYHLGWIEQTGESEWIWKRFEENRYRVTLSESGDDWQLVADPLQEYVYLHPLWYRIATLDFYKIECERTIYNVSTDQYVTTRN